MPTELEQIRDQQQATWDKFSVGWKKWDKLVLGWLADVGTALLDGARLRSDSHVLDIASGTGEPALSAAARCPQGTIMMTDLADKMLVIAKESAERRGLRNVETRQCDAGALPFADSTYDAVMARFGFMFFPEVLGAARELARVARPGARVCASVWGPPEKNPWATMVMGAISKHVQMPAPPPGAPGLFRCAAPGYMAGVFREAGLKSVTELEVAAPLHFDSPEEYFAFMNEIAAPVVAGMAKADEGTRAKIKEEVIALATQLSSHGKIRLSGSASTPASLSPNREDGYPRRGLVHNGEPRPCVKLRCDVGHGASSSAKDIRTCKVARLERQDDHGYQRAERLESSNEHQANRVAFARYQPRQIVGLRSRDDWREQGTRGRRASLAAWTLGSSYPRGTGASHSRKASRSV